MTTALQHRRGTTAQHSTFTGAPGELTVDTSKTTVVVHDGTTTGGIPLAKESSIASTIRFDVSQTLTEPQKGTSRSNIGASPTASSNGFMVQLTDGSVIGRTLEGGVGIEVWGGDGSETPVVNNAGVLSIGGATGDISLGYGVSLVGGELRCSSGVSSVGGLSGDLTPEDVASVLSDITCAAGTVYRYAGGGVSATGTSYLEIVNFAVLVSGVLRVQVKGTSTTTTTSTFLVYKNGVVAGVPHTVSTTAHLSWTDDVTVSPGDTIQVFAKNGGGGTATIDDVSVGTSSFIPVALTAPLVRGQR